MEDVAECFRASTESPRFEKVIDMAKSGMSPKTLQYLMGYSDIRVMMNTYTLLGLEDTADELNRMEYSEIARNELDKAKGEK